ncbi:16S rRNA (cytidine(1402)-2'-O)-methyltransferase [Candidatus Nomurabacteria bacterium]|nr:16S rRNA (cytidine(1402)-2'-O)-methyltransferase [Candidatus Nomurabacteria bacterium]
MSTLFIVATPIGNRDDISARALKVLTDVDLIACEDTRVTKRFLESYEIYTSLISYHAQSPDRKEEYICDLLKKGKDIALVSDAGTPAISDPGTRLVARVYQSVPDAKVIVIPGPSAVTALLSASGISTHPYTFYGFLPHKKGRKTLIAEILENKHTSVVYESPHRVLSFIKSCIEYGAGERLVVLGRELTKLYEEILRLSFSEVYEYFMQHPEKIKGEFVIAITGTKHKNFF